MEDKRNEADKKAESSAKLFGAIVYGGVVVVATVLFISFVLLAFDEKQYFSRMVMVIGGVLVGASTLAFPVALHNWAVDGHHRTWAVGLYIGELTFIAFNTVVSFTALLALQGKVVMPDWMLQYEPYSILSIVYVLAAWGTLFFTDPMHKVKALNKQYEVKYANRVQALKMEFLNSIEGEELMEEQAVSEARKAMGMEKQALEKQHFGKGRKTAGAFASDTKQEEIKEKK